MRILRRSANHLQQHYTTSTTSQSYKLSCRTSLQVSIQQISTFWLQGCLVRSMYLDGDDVLLQSDVKNSGGAYLRIRVPSPDQAPVISRNVRLVPVIIGNGRSCWQGCRRGFVQIPEPGYGLDLLGRMTTNGPTIRARPKRELGPVRPETSQAQSQTQT